MKKLFARRQRGYFDSGSFTPIHSKSYTAIKEVLSAQVSHRAGNPLSQHEAGRMAGRYMNESKKIVAGINRVKENNVLFSPSTTESNFIAMRTAVLYALRRGMSLTDMHFVLGPEDHPSLYRIAAYFSEFGISYSIAKPSSDSLTPDDMVACLRDNTVFLSVQYVNSQHGEVYPVAEIADACRAVRPNLFVHSDAAQATAYFDCSPFSLRVNTVAIDGSKSFGPQGASALLFQNLLMYTGLSGENTLWDMHPGTPAVSLVYGFAVALREAAMYREERASACRRIKNLLIAAIAEFAPDTYMHGARKKITDIAPADYRTLSPHLLSLSFPDTQHAYLATLLNKEGFAVSTKVACGTKPVEALRIGVIPITTEREARALSHSIQKNLSLAKNDIYCK